MIEIWTEQMTCPWGRTEHRKNRRGKKVLAFCESTHHYYQQFMVKRRSLSFDKCTAHHYAQGHSAVGAELGSAHRSSANDGYAGALYIPLSHSTGLEMRYKIPTHATTVLFMYLYSDTRES